LPQSLLEESSQKKISPLTLAYIDSNKRYLRPPHLVSLDDYLQDVAHGIIKRLMVFMPPRHAKSETISKYFTSWFLGRFPNKRIILTSYEADFAATWGYKSRNILTEHSKDFDIEIDNQSAARNRWNIKDHQGGMVTAGVGGPITGKGADVLIIDDPVKNAEEANSQTMRDKAWDWYNSTAYTRLEPDGAVILIMTRWHEDDLAGRILSESKEDWTVLNLPAIAEEDDPLGREIGEALWPERYPIKRLNEIKAQVGEYWFSALYQQRPQPAKGGLLKREWITTYDTPIDLTKKQYKVFQGWDLAISEKETADYTCSCTVALDPDDNNIYVLDWTHEHIDFPTQVKAVIRKADEYKPQVIGIEDVAYQRALPQQVLKQRLLNIKPIKRVNDKVTRITSGFVLFENGIVHIPINHANYNDFVNEYVHFPQGRHDDLLDATEIALGLAQLYTGSSYAISKRKYDYAD